MQQTELEYSTLDISGSITVAKDTYTWTVFSGMGKPGPDIGTKVGDVYRDVASEVIWILHRHNVWLPAKVELDSRGNPEQRFPSPRSNGKHIANIFFDSGIGNWVPKKRYYKNKPKAAESLMRHKTSSSEEVYPRATSQPSGQGDHGHAGAGGDGPVQEPILARVAPSHILPDVEEHAMKAQNPHNQWLEELHYKFTYGPSKLAQAQVPKGAAIIEAILQLTQPVPCDKTIGTKHSFSIVGKAKRASLSAPILEYAVRDLITSKYSNFSDSVTNLRETDIDAAEFLALKMNFDAGIPLMRGRKLFGAFDVPATRGGLMKCGWRFPPFSDAKNCTLSELTNSWTLPGAITYPHMDGLACGMYIIHWEGEKLWLMWPATRHNLWCIETSLTSSPDLTATVSLIGDLEGLELLHLSNEEGCKELAFYLHPNTIHCCLSFTECHHAGAPVRSADFLDVVETVMDWAGEWFTQRLIPGTGIDTTDKVTHVKEYIDAIRRWSALQTCVDDEEARMRIQKMVSSAKAAVKPAISFLGMRAPHY